MYKKHPSLKTPGDNTIVWRYLDLSKFISLLEKKALYFRRFVLLDDPFEGSVPEKNFRLYRTELVAGRAKLIEHMKKRGLDEKIIDQMYPKIPEDLQEKSSVMKAFKHINYVNCWHISRYESDAMWKLYLNTGEGVAIKSTIGRLKKSLERTDMHLYIGKVNYIDYKKDKLPPDNVMRYLISKRKSFEHEKELRLITSYLPPDIFSDDDLERMPPFPKKGFQIAEDHGLYMEVDLSKLINGIFIAPTSQDMILSICKSLVDKYGLRIEVHRSYLIGKPLFY